MPRKYLPLDELDLAKREQTTNRLSAQFPSAILMNIAVVCDSAGLIVEKGKGKGTFKIGPYSITLSERGGCAEQDSVVEITNASGQKITINEWRTPCEYKMDDTELLVDENEDVKINFNLFLYKVLAAADEYLDDQISGRVRGKRITTHDQVKALKDF